MSNFHLENPHELLNKMRMLGHLRKLGVDKVLKTTSQGYREKYFYKFEHPLFGIQYDFNWEALLFLAKNLDLENILTPHIDECIKIQEQELEEVKNLTQLETNENHIKTVSIYDLAAKDIAKMNDTSRIILPNA